MKKSIKKYLVLTPVVVLFSTMFFLNYTVQYFKDTSYNFVYDTNAGSVISFSEELRALTAQGYTRYEYGSLFSTMIFNFNVKLGEKDAIVTFLLDEEGQIRHSNDNNKDYLADILQNEENMKLINDAFDARRNGEIITERDGVKEPMYYHWFFSGDDDYCLFMCVDKKIIEAQVNVNGVVIPISLIGLLLLIMSEYIIWLKTSGSPDGDSVPEKGEDDDKREEDDAD
jgi:hypothetical protein